MFVSDYNYLAIKSQFPLTLFRINKGRCHGCAAKHPNVAVYLRGEAGASPFGGPSIDRKVVDEDVSMMIYSMLVFVTFYCFTSLSVSCLLTVGGRGEKGKTLLREPGNCTYHTSIVSSEVTRCWFTCLMIHCVLVFL